MYNKIASIILNSAKADGLSDVFVAQPDSLKENLAGKIFVIAEIGGKKTDGRKIFDFLVSALNDNYYNDDKILFRGKIEGLKIENIFEAAIAKTNKNLADFLTIEKIKINAAETNITLGVIYENNLHFTTVGRNRALLIYRHGEEYEVINVETSATEVPIEINTNESTSAAIPKLFSSVISGEVPLNSYFVFASEALPEYLSGREMIKIITKLPPITAAEQIKNVLMKINTYVPFLGIIIKNTTGSAGQEIKEEPEEASSAHSSISSLNYTEAKTEQMLAPAGLISFSKFSKQIKKLFANWRSVSSRRNKKYISSDEKTENSASQPLPSAILNLGTVNSLNSIRPDSFLIKDKIFFKKKTGRLFSFINKFRLSLVGFLNPKMWFSLGGHLKSGILGLNAKNRWLLITLGAIIIIFTGSLIFTNWNHKRQLAQTNFNNLVTAIEDKQNSIDAHLLYNDNAGAGQVLVEAQALLSSLSPAVDGQQTEYQRLADELGSAAAKIQKIIKIDQATKINDLSGLGINSLVYAGSKIYGAGGKFIYDLTPNSSSSTKMEIKGANNLINPFYDRQNSLYYWDNNFLVQYNIKTKNSSRFSVNIDQTSKPTSFKVYQDKYLYLIAKTNNQIYKYTKSASGFSAKNDWLKENLDLSLATDLFVIDGDIYVLNNNGEVLKLYINKKADYKASAILPVMTNASKFIVGANYIYIFEAGSKRLAVLSKKDGLLVNQYQVNSLTNPRDFTVDEAGRTAYFLDNEAVYKISLNQ
ncbi:MAG: hypothetical protein WC249_02165 [Patescibacteria group bacterium]|jgi:hypothetical protein